MLRQDRNKCRAEARLTRLDQTPRKTEIVQTHDVRYPAEIQESILVGANVRGVVLPPQRLFVAVTTAG